MNKKSSHRCFQCNSSLTLVSRITEKIVGSRFPQTTSKYRCTNIACQDKKDKEAAKRKEDQEGRELASQERAKRIQEKRIAAKVSYNKAS